MKKRNEKLIHYSFYFFLFFNYDITITVFTKSLLGALTAMRVLISPVMYTAHLFGESPPSATEHLFARNLALAL